MNEKGDKLMKFGPEWLQNNLTRENSAHGNNSANITAKNRISTKFKSAEHKYKRDDLLSFYRGKEDAPEELKSVETIYVPKSQVPIGLQFCPRRVRAKRPLLPRNEIPNFEMRPNRWSREPNRPQINYFQPRWVNENNWRQNHHLNRSQETEEMWRNGRQEISRSLTNNRWNERGRDRREFQASYMHDSWIDDRHSPDDMLPEWANSSVDETGTFDATGAFLPIVNNNQAPQCEENNNVRFVQNVEPSGNIEPKEKMLEINFQNEGQIPSEAVSYVNELNKTAGNNNALMAQFDVNDPSSSIEDYLNKLMQEDENEGKKSRVQQFEDFSAINYTPESSLTNLLSQIKFNNAVPPELMQEHFHKNAINIPMDNNFGWYYHDLQNIIRGPFAAIEMFQLFKSGYFNNCSLIRKGNGPHTLPLSQLFDLCGAIPFLLPDYITNNIFNLSPYNQTTSDAHNFFHENTVEINQQITNKPSPPIKDFINAATIPLERFNHQISEHPSNPIVTNEMFVGGSMQFPINNIYQLRPNISVHQFQPNLPIDTLPFSFNQFPSAPQEHINPPSMPVQVDPMAHNNWGPLNHPHHNLSWIDPSLQTKIHNYVPIPMPGNAHNPQIPNQEPTSILSHANDDFLSGLNVSNLTINPGNTSPQASVCNIQSNVSTSMTNSPLWNNQMPATLETFDYNMSALAQRQKLLFNLSPQQQPQQFPPLEPPVYISHEKINPMIKEDSGKFLNMIETMKKIQAEVKSSNKKKSEDKKHSKQKEPVTQKPQVAKQQTTEGFRKIQKKTNQPPLIANVPWNSRDDSQNIENVQMKSAENNSNYVKNHVMSTNDVQNSSATVIRDKVITSQPTHFTWANSKPLSTTNISLADIQAEEQFQHSKLEKSASTSRVFHSMRSRIWINSNENFSLEGFWDTQSNKSKSGAILKTQSHGQVGGSKPNQNVQRVEKEKVSNKITISKETKEFKNSDKNYDDARNKFVLWAKNELKFVSESIDVPAFVSFLCTLESPYEIEDYVKTYLGETKTSIDFAKSFLQRRSQMLFAKSRPIHCDDLCSPAPAFNPSIDKREDPKNKNKKKKGKMSRIDSRILGFNSTASENRFNIGNIDVP